MRQERYEPVQTLPACPWPAIPPQHSSQPPPGPSRFSHIAASYRVRDIALSSYQDMPTTLGSHLRSSPFSSLVTPWTHAEVKNVDEICSILGVPSFRLAAFNTHTPTHRLPAVHHFSIRQLPPKLWKCGNLACPWQDFQWAVERGGNLLLAFHAFHSPGISTALFLACFRFWRPTAIIRHPRCFPPVDSSWRAPPGNSGCSAR
jgi:hypothetical protein